MKYTNKWKNRWREIVTDNVYTFIGLAMKAGKLVSGEQNCEKTIKCGKALLVIVSEDASTNTEKKFKDACLYRRIPFYRFGEKERLGKSLGKGFRSVIAITDKGFSRKLANLITEQSNKKHGGGLIE